MAKRKLDLSGEFEEELDFLEPAEEGSKAQELLDEVMPEPLSIPKSPYQLILKAIRRVDDGRMLAEGDNGNFYLVDKLFEFPPSKEAFFIEGDSQIERLYTWEKEIEAALPERSALVKQIRLSLYLAGAFYKGDLKKNEVLRNGTRYAFPYKFQEVEE